ncbi:MAG: LysM peptidoglycan-binding domain-containing protein [Paracoccaceae bacterium]|nr:LysM peptidoglycan-binding domain-containing protein [Paracoccaceae bacterium]
MTEKKSQSRLPVWIALGLLFITIVGAYAFQANKAFKIQDPLAINRDQEASLEVFENPASEPSDASTLEGSPIAEITAERKTDSDIETSSQAVESKPEVEETLRGPVLGTVRVDKDGAVVMAGTGFPGQNIDVLLDDGIIVTIVADGRGDFVAIFALPYSAKMRVLSLKSDVGGVALYSKQQVIIAPAQIKAPIETAQADISQEIGSEREKEPELEQGSVSQKTEPEPQNIDPGAQESFALENANEQAGEVEELAVNVVSAGAEDKTTEDVEIILLDVQVAKLEAEAVDKADMTIDMNAVSAPSIETEIEEDVSSDDMAKTEVEAVDKADMTIVSNTASAMSTEAEIKEDIRSDDMAKTEAEAGDKADTSIDTKIVGALSNETKIKEDVASAGVVKTEASIEQKLDTNMESLSETSHSEKRNVEDGIAKDEAIPVETTAAEQTKTLEVETLDNGVESLSLALKEEANQPAIQKDAKINNAKAEPSAAETKGPAVDVVASVKPSDPLAENTQDAEKAPVVMIADDNGVRVIQSDKDKAESDVALDTISYDDEGDVALTGRGQPSGFVRIYLDNTPISTAAMDATGQWNTALSEIDPGIYTLRIDQLDPTGQVSSRLETPFKRESIETLQSQLLALEEPARINVVTVQPGNTLWAIARERYGMGILYVRVFEANRDKIRDENLIYPGQIFELPD